MTIVLPMKLLKVDYYRRTKHPFIRLDDNHYDENSVGIDLAYPKSYEHVEGFNLLEISLEGLFKFEDVGYDFDDVKPTLDVNLIDGTLKVIGVDIV